MSSAAKDPMLEHVRGKLVKRSSHAQKDTSKEVT